VALSLELASLSGCRQKEEPRPAASASAKAPAPAVQVDAQLFQRLKEIGQACNVDAVEGSVTCPQGENRRLISEFVTNQRPRGSAVATLASALADPNPAVQTAAANVLNAAFRAPWAADVEPGSVKAADAKSLLAAALKLPKQLARQALPGAVHAGFLAGVGNDVYTALDQADETELRPLGYRYVMTHGRLGAFGKVQQLAKDPNLAIALAALEAPRSMHDWSEAEKAALCPWALELLQDPRQSVASRGAGLLSSCSGDFVDRLLERAESTLKDGKFNLAELAGLRDVCSAANVRQPGGATEQQCQRNRKLLGDVIASKKLDAQLRGQALIALAYQWPDDKTLKLARSLEKNADKNLAEQAGRTVERLEQRKKTSAKMPLEKAAP
jgi:hypothetical protein